MNKQGKKKGESSDGHGCSPVAGSLQPAQPGEGRKPYSSCSLQPRGTESLGSHSYRSEPWAEPAKTPEQVNTGQGFGRSCPLRGGQYFRQRNKSHRAQLPLRLPKLASCHPWCQVEEHIICKPSAIVAESLFSSVIDLSWGT